MVIRRPLYVVACAWCFVSSANADPTGQQLAQQLDRIRRPLKSFTVNVTLTDIRDNKPDTITNFIIYARKTTGYPDFDTITRCDSPENDRGKVVLTKSSEAWLYDPKSSRPVSIPFEKMRSKFFFAYGLTTSFVREYDAENIGPEKAVDAARREHACWHLKLAHRSTAGPGQEIIDYWLDKESLRPVRGQIFSANGKLLRTVYYTEFKNVLDEIRPTRLVVIIHTEPGLVTDIHFTNLAYRDTAANFYTMEAMPLMSRGTVP
jgi:outer membrane lipoprotein-sorting protein